MLNFSNGDTEFPLPSSAARAWSARSEKEKKKKLTNELWQCHCRNRGINFFLATVAMALSKMGGKNVVPKSRESKKKRVTFTIFSQ